MSHEVVVNPKALIVAELFRTVVGLRSANQTRVLVAFNPPGNRRASFAVNSGKRGHAEMEKVIAIQGMEDGVWMGMPFDGGTNVVRHVDE